MPVLSKMDDYIIPATVTAVAAYQFGKLIIAKHKNVMKIPFLFLKTKVMILHIWLSHAWCNSIYIIKVTFR